MSTMADVARRAGVTLSTVSHTLSGKRPVSAEVKKRVYQAIEELKYQPNLLARALATRHARTLALMYPLNAPELSAPQVEFLANIANAATEYNYALLLWTAHDASNVISMIQQGFISGCILMEIACNDTRVQAFQELKCPFVMLGQRQHNEGISYVDFDFKYAMQEGVRYLAELGHTHIALLGHQEILWQREISYVRREREAFLAAMKQRGLVALDCFCESNERAGYDITNELLAKDQELSAIIIANPWVSGGVMRALTDRGLNVPEDFSLLAMATSPGLAEMTTPALSSMDFPYAEMGRLGAHILIQQLESNEANVQQQLLKPTLVVRRSSGPYRGSKYTPDKSNLLPR